MIKIRFLSLDKNEFNQFVDEELIHFSNADNIRSSFNDGWSQTCKQKSTVMSFKDA